MQTYIMSKENYTDAFKECQETQLGVHCLSDSAPADWQEILRQTGLQCAVSPIHDSDLDPTGEPKNPTIM